MTELAAARNVRSQLLHFMDATLKDHNHWDYDAVRPMHVPPSWHRGQHVRGDCSKGVQYLVKWSGGPDPMQEGFGPFGNSSTLAARLHHVGSIQEMQVGDIITFGPGGDEHAAMVKRRVLRGKKVVNLELWSFGSPAAPNTYYLSQDYRTHQLLRLPVGPMTPHSPDGLRLMTGYWSWLQWRLGEGYWKHYKPKARGVKPKTPRPIPLRWWRRYRRMVRHRKHGNKATMLAPLPPVDPEVGG